MMKTCQIDTAFFDFGGVIADEGFAEGIKALADRFGIARDDLWKQGLQTVWDSGYVFGRAEEATFWSLFKERTGLTGDHAEWREDILSRFVVRPWMLDVVSRMKACGVRVAILSDQTDWLARLDERQQFFRYFDKIYNSYNYAMTKQEPGFFLMALQDLGADPRRTLFVDDNPGNVARARGLGLSAILYETRDGFERDLARICPDALPE